MKHLLENWEGVKGLFINPIFFMTDFDGTLSPIVEKPEMAEMSPDLRPSLSRLAELCPVAIVSGRGLSDLKSRVLLEDVYYAGNHGYEIEGPDLDFVKEEAKEARKSIEKICDRIQRRADYIDGVIVEDKIYTASVHYRRVEDEIVSDLWKIVEEETKPFREKDLVKVSHGKKVYEIKPSFDWDKGKAVSLLLNVASVEEETLTIYIGDDTTDEDAFEVLRNSGVGILVSKKDKDSAADFRLRNVEEVGELLFKLVDLLESF